MKEFRSNGKLLLTGEYAVLDGAMALALPTRYGQSLEVSPGSKENVSWKSLDENNKPWFEANFSLKNGQFKADEQFTEQQEQATSLRLQEILQKAYQLNPEQFGENMGYEIVTRLDFNRYWGLGTSSTLINNIAQWLKIDAYKLLDETFGGSGYDIAVARHQSPLTYQLTSSGRSVLRAGFSPAFHDELFFVYLNRKQNSRQAIAHYRNQPEKDLKVLTEKVSALSRQILECTEINEFELLIEIHENLISKAIKLPKIKSRLFPNYPRTIKSLGGWGGDFILATGTRREQDYFREKGYEVIIPFSKMIL